MTVITGVATSATGVPIAGRAVTVRLVASSPLLIDGGQVIQPAATITDAAGAWALIDLIPSSAFVDTAAHYEIDDGHGAPYVVLAPDSGTHDVGTVLIVPPTPSGVLSASAEALLALVPLVQAASDGGYKGTWASGTAYRVGDTVQHSTTLYGALKTSTGVTPGTDATTWKIYPSSGGGGGAVASVFGRDGDVAAQAGDYAVADITGLATALDSKQPVDADLTAIAALTPTNDDVLQRKSGAWTNRTMAQLKTDLVLSKADVGLGNADNTADGSKPVSTAQAAADAVVAAAASAALSGHASDTTGVHGIADTTALVLTGDARLADARVPLAHPHNADDITSGTLAIARIPTGSTGSTVPLGNDARLSDTRTPTDGSVTTAKIGDSQVTLAKVANIAAATMLGNNTGGATAPIALTASQVKTLLAIVQGDVSGLTAALAALAPLASPALTGTATAANLTISGRQLYTSVALTSGTTVAVNAALGNDFTLVAAHNFTLANPINPVASQRILFAIRQDGTGSRILTLDSAYRLGADIDSVVLSTDPNTTDYLGVRYNATDSVWDVIAFVKGY